jgi:integrase/recombinase XerD
MKEAIAKFLTYLEHSQGRAHNTLMAYRADLLQMEDVLATQHVGPVAPEGFSRDLLEGYVNWLTTQGYRPATVSRKMAALRSFLEYLSQVERRCDRSLIHGLKPPPTPRRRPRILSKNEIDRLLQAPLGSRKPRGLRDAAILALLYATGMRAAETVALDVSDIDFEQGMVRKPMSFGERLPLGIAEEPLRLYLLEGRPSLMKMQDEQALFLNQRGRRLSRQGLWLVVKRWASALALGDEVSPHTLRHTLANHLLGEGLSTQEVQRVLGLSSPTAIRLIRVATPLREEGAGSESVPQS